MTDTTLNARTIREFTRIFKNEHDAEGVGHLFDPEFRHNFAAPLPPGLAGFKAVGHMMNGAFPDVVVTEEDLVVTGDRVVERSTARATHGGDFNGIPATGKTVTWSEIHIYRMKAGKIAEHWAELSMLELLQLLGAIPAAG